MFTVARLLIVERFGAIPSGTKIYSGCGLSQCVNPDHWIRERVPAPLRIDIHADGVWQLVHARTGTVAREDCVLRALHDGVVHVVRVLAHDQRSSVAPPRAICGLELLPRRIILLGSDADVTCTGGC